MSKNNIIRLENVNYTITEGTKARILLNDISCNFLKSSITVISGPSGSGKTTLLYAIAGLLDNVKGNIFIDGTNINVNDEKKRNAFRLENISMVFQNLNLFSFMNVEDNILVPYYIKEKKVDSSVYELLRKYLEVMKLGQIQKKSIQSLSGGEQQRVAIIRALIDEPKVVLCDEPTANLDRENVEIFMKTLLEIKQTTNASIIIVTHDSRVYEYGEKKIHITDGKLSSVD